MMTLGLAIVLWTLLPLIGIYVVIDVRLYLKYGASETISHGFYTYGKKVPLIPFVIGLIIGGLAVHFWTG